MVRTAHFLCENRGSTPLEHIFSKKINIPQLAQLVEQKSFKLFVIGSSPILRVPILRLFWMLLLIIINYFLFFLMYN